MASQYDVIVVGSGPGGYVAAIRASQLGMKTAVIERESLGGICLNWGCIPTKALLKSAQVFEYIKHSSDYGITVQGKAQPDFTAVIKRSRGVADSMSKGVQFLMKKNKIDVLNGVGKVKPGKKVDVTDKDGKVTEYEAKHIIIATGSRARQLPSVPLDGEKVIEYRKAMTLEKRPDTMVVVGSGAIGVEFAYVYASMGTKVTIIEFLPNIVPVEDEEISKELAKQYRKMGVQIFTSSEVTKVDTSGPGCKVTAKTPEGEKQFDADIVLSAAGIVANIENIGLEEVGITVDRGRIVTDDYYRTNVEGYYAIGDVTKGQALAHVASAEAIICVEKIANQPHVEPLNYNNIPGCTYCTPEIASVGYTERAAREAGYELKVGKFPFTASGKAKAAGTPEGFVKVIFDAKYGEFLGAHLIGNNVTEMIAEVVAARKLETTGEEILKAVHPHPTMSEAIKDATEAAYGEAIHL